jgi:prepilin-type N-terminal cleavage/methylation domain-containing protein
MRTPPTLRSPLSAASAAEFAALRRTARGFVLLEIIFAMALFGIVCVSLTQALQQIARTSHVTRKEARVIRVMESVLAEVSHAPEFKPGSVSVDPGADGVAARAEISLAKPYTKNMFRVRVEAWIPDGREKTVLREMETFVYSPNSRES